MAKSAAKTRKHIIAIINKQIRKGTTAEQVIEALERQHPEILRAEKEEIFKRGLRVIVNESFNLRKTRTTGVQGELFAEYNVGDVVAVRLADNDGKLRKMHKAFANLTKAELREYISQHEERPVRTSRHVSEASRILRDIKDVGSDNWTVAECLKAARSRVGSA